jgi:undecaprenyl-diphosphatase
MPSVSYLEAIVMGALQGVTELFPISSLGHSVLLPALIGGSWAVDLDVTAKDSPYLAVLVAMHVATALALVLFFRRDWVRIVNALGSSIRHRRADSPDQRLAWLLVVGTIPVGLAGLALDSTLRTVLGKPVPAAIFLALNGAVLFGAERVRQGASASRRGSHNPDNGGATPNRSAQQTAILPAIAADEMSDRRLSRLRVGEALAIGATQSLALLPGISRSGITIAGGLLRGLRHEDAARFAFLLATPVILAAGVLKLPTLFTAANEAVLMPALCGSVVAGVAAYISVRFLTRYFESRTLTPFAAYCVIGGIGSLAYLTIR